MKQFYYILHNYRDNLNPTLEGLFYLTNVYGTTAEIRQGDKVYYTPMKKLKKYGLR